MFEVTHADDIGGNEFDSPIAPHSAQFNRRILLEAIVCDLHWAGLHIGTLSCLLNAHVKSNKEWTLRPWRHLLNDDVKISELGLRYSRNIGVPKALEEKLLGLYREFSQIKALLEPLAGGPSKRGIRVTISAQDIATRLRRLSGTTIDALSIVEPIIRERLIDLYVANGRILREFLHEAVTGKSARVNEFGEITLPVLAQRRRSTRVEAKRSCVLVDGERFISATVLDVSRGGIGIACNQTLSLGAVLSLQIDDEFRRDVTVIWQRDTRAGLRFTNALVSDDAILQLL